MTELSFVLLLSVIACATVRFSVLFAFLQWWKGDQKFLESFETFYAATLENIEILISLKTLLVAIFSAKIFGFKTLFIVVL